MNRTSHSFRLATAAASVLLTLAQVQSVAMLAGHGRSRPATSSPATTLALAVSKIPPHSVAVR